MVFITQVIAQSAQQSQLAVPTRSGGGSTSSLLDLSHAGEGGEKTPRYIP